MTSRESQSELRPDISVIIPCFNAERYVRECLTSVLSQDFDNFEVVVVDDGSTDSSMQILSNLPSKRVKVASQKNAGAAAARNHGFRVSSGRTVLFLDADDVLSPGHLTSLYNTLDGSETDIAFGRWQRFTTAWLHVTPEHRNSYRTAPATEWLIDEFASGEAMFQSAMFLLPRTLLDKCGLWDEELSLIDDFEFFARQISSAKLVRHAPGALIYYRSGVPGSLSSSAGQRAASSAFRSLIQGTRHLLEKDSGPRARRSCANVMQSFDYAYFPAFPSLRRRARARVRELGGADLIPTGPPKFHALRRVFGWRVARLVELAARGAGLRRGRRGVIF